MTEISVITKTTMVPISSLKPNPRNAAIHPQSQLNSLANSFREFGFIGSVVVDKDDMIIAGHGRVLAAAQAGMTEVPVIYASHLSDDQVRALMHMDNELSKQKETDHELLAIELGELSASFDFGGDFGVDLDRMMASLSDDTEGGEVPGRSSDPREGLDRDEDDDYLYEEEDRAKTEEIDREDFDAYIPKPDEDESASIEDNDAPIPFSVEARVTAGSAWRLGSHLLVCGNSSDASTVHKFIPEESAHSIVTDPPYGISFMGKEWDHGVPSSDLWKVWISRITPGAHILSFCATRMYHHMAIQIENAGFEPKDMIGWLYGSGMPKSHNISKAIDKAAGAEREVIGEGNAFGRGSAGNKTRVEQGYRPTEINPDGGVNLITAPSTPSAKQWDGYGTHIKPAIEPIMLALKPISEKTIAKNVQRYGTGGVNIDGSRVALDISNERRHDLESTANEQSPINTHINWGGGKTSVDYLSKGRWPANVILSHSEGCVEVGVKKVGSGEKKKNSEVSRPNYDADSFNSFSIVKANQTESLVSYGTETVEAWECVQDCAVRLLDEQSGVLKSGSLKAGQYKNGVTHDIYGEMKGWDSPEVAANSGGASRFFYIPKPSKSDKNEGNDHATVKPIRLMEYLIRMITPKGGTVLEPFAGSGTTLLACERLKMKCIAFELYPHHCDIVIHRWQTMTGLQAEPYTQG